MTLSTMCICEVLAAYMILSPFVVHRQPLIEILAEGGLGLVPG
jgi:hypothetical protein